MRKGGPMRAERKREKRPENRPIRVITVFMTLLAAGMILYLLLFLLFGREEVIKSPYNNRLDSGNVIRGKILSTDGVTLAGMETDTEGNDRRVYPYGELFTVATGYTGIGRTGLESSCHSMLMQASVPMKDRLKAEISDERLPGDNVVTTIDSDLQHYCFTLLGERKGSVVCVNPKTGDILAMVSKPTFDAGTVRENWESLTSPDNDSGQLLNRVTQGLYPPGSTFKIITAIAYMKAHPDTYKDFRYTCTGSYELDGVTVKCGDGTGHGTEDLIHAMGNSCNAAFIEMGLSLDRAEYRKLCGSLGFGERLIRDIPNTASSVTIGADSSDFEMMQTAFGQGNTMETPLQNVFITAMAANGGVMMKPRLLDHTENAYGTVKSRTEVTELGRFLTDKQADYLNRCLIAVVNEGTTPQAAVPGMQVAGKSGTAQYSSSMEDMHAWFTAYAPAEDPKIALTVMLEKGGSGSVDAAPLAAQIISYYFSR